MTTCREFFTFSWPLRGRGVDPSGQPDRFFPVFFYYFPNYSSAIFQLTWRSQESQIPKCPHLTNIFITGFGHFMIFLPFWKYLKNDSCCWLPCSRVGKVIASTIPLGPLSIVQGSSRWLKKLHEIRRPRWGLMRSHWNSQNHRQVDKNSVNSEIFNPPQYTQFSYHLLTTHSLNWLSWRDRDWCYFHYIRQGSSMRLGFTAKVGRI